MDDVFLSNVSFVFGSICALSSAVEFRCSYTMGNQFGWIQYAKYSFLSPPFPKENNGTMELSLSGQNFADTVTQQPMSRFTPNQIHWAHVPTGPNVPYSQGRGPSSDLLVIS